MKKTFKLNKKIMWGILFGITISSSIHGIDPQDRYYMDRNPNYQDRDYQDNPPSYAPITSPTYIPNYAPPPSYHSPVIYPTNPYYAPYDPFPDKRESDAIFRANQGPPR